MSGTKPLLVSQYQQDEWLNDVWPTGFKGFFVDVGAADGLKLSNTYNLEKTHGWSGVCMEPRPDDFKMLRENRPNSFCLNYCAFDGTKNMVDFYWIGQGHELLSGIPQFMEPESTIMSRILPILQNFPNGLRKGKVSAVTLQQVLDQQKRSHIDLLCVDTEGSEMPVLRGLDWDKTTVEIACVEANTQKAFSELVDFFSGMNYGLVKVFKQDCVFASPSAMQSSLNLA